VKRGRGKREEEKWKKGLEEKEDKRSRESVGIIW
jgi:hypothetical protein